MLSSEQVFIFTLLYLVAIAIVGLLYFHHEEKNEQLETM